MAKPIRLGILLSGGGWTLENILGEIRAGRLAAEVVLVIASREKIRGLEVGRAAGVATHLVRPKEFPTVQAYSDAMAHLFDEARVDLVCLAGFLSYWIIPDRYLGRVINIHPALLPSFGGKGMYGHHVHEAVLARGCKVSGCTVHFVDNAYDEGPIILQRSVAACAEDTPDTLAARVFAEECIAYTEAIRLYAAGRIHLDGRVVRIQGDHANPLTAGFACAKVNRDHELVHSPRRLATPLRRVGPKGEGKFAPLGWDEALDEIVGRWKAIIAQSGPLALLGYAYSAHQGQINHGLVNGMFHALGTSRLQGGTVCDTCCETA